MDVLIDERLSHALAEGRASSSSQTKSQLFPGLHLMPKGRVRFFD
jgi:hypothetical protein